jgi:hypothetical protein
MIAMIAGAVDRFLGRGDAAVTVPPLDGAFRPNRRLDDAADRAALAGVDALAVAGGVVHASSGGQVMIRDGAQGWQVLRDWGVQVTALAPFAGGLAVALADGRLAVTGGRHDGWQVNTGLRCIIALAEQDGTILAANGAEGLPPDDWQRDLMQRGTSGSVWRIAPATGQRDRLAAGLAWPAGLAVDGQRGGGQGVVVAEAWRHRLIRLDGTVLFADMPGYPGRIAAGPQGYWLAMFAPRSQLVEFVLREPAYRRRMLAEVPQAFWVAPRLRAGRSFYESLQGGGVKQLGMLKPWAPTMSAGICVRLDAGFQPRASLQSRADGATHGVTAAVEHDGQLVIAARGDGVVVTLPLISEDDR